MYEALMRAALSGFQTWLTENRENKKRAVDDAFNGLTSLCDNICKAKFQDKPRNQSFTVLDFLPGHGPDIAGTAESVKRG